MLMVCNLILCDLFGSLPSKSHQRKPRPPVYSDGCPVTRPPCFHATMFPYKPTTVVCMASAVSNVPFVQLSLLGFATGLSYFLSSFQKQQLDGPVRKREERPFKRSQAAGTVYTTSQIRRDVVLCRKPRGRLISHFLSQKLFPTSPLIFPQPHPCTATLFTLTLNSTLRLISSLKDSHARQWIFYSWYNSLTGENGKCLHVYITTPEIKEEAREQQMGELAWHTEPDSLVSVLPTAILGQQVGEMVLMHFMPNKTAIGMITDMHLQANDMSPDAIFCNNFEKPLENFLQLSTAFQAEEMVWETL